MVTELLTILSSIGNTLYEIFVMPGDFLLSWFAAVAPVTAIRLDIAADEPGSTLAVVLSLLYWVLLVVALAMAWKFFRNATRFMDSTVRTLWHRIALAVSGLKTKVVLKLRRLLPHRAKNTVAPTPMVEFDDLDLAVLRSASAQGPGFALSAPELAENFSLLPSQIQRSLDKLNQNKMLDSVVGSTDGFGNYRLTDSGAAFITLWQRQAARS